MNRIRREVLNGLFVLVLSTLLSAAVAAFQLKFNLQVWAFIVMGVAIERSRIEVGHSPCWRGAGNHQ
jgi:hypothetical protein